MSNITVPRALLQQALEALWLWMDADSSHTEQHAAYHALKAALAQQEQEPVAWGLFAKTDGEWVLQHPVFVGECGKANAEAERASYSGPTPLEVRPLGVIAHPPRREWQSLTEEEIKHFAWNGFLMGEGLWNEDTEEDLLAFTRAVEQALKEKNQ